MGKALIIAEKPSVANDIAKALGGFKKEKDFFENEEFRICSAIGHLLEICAPEGVEVKRGKWNLENLPVIPQKFDLRPIAKTEARLKLLNRLIRKKDTERLINACDAGREGELIFRYIVQHSKTKKPIQRLWLQSMTPTAIKEGFQKLRSDEEMLPLSSAAMCRSESDWLVGINGTRAVTAFNSKLGGFQLTTVGRVQTPTLTVVVDREEKIKKFVPEAYWEIHAEFQGKAGSYEGRWFDEKFVREKNGNPGLKAERIWEKEKAEGIHNRCEDKPGVVTEVSKPTSQMPAPLFDLTSLQRLAHGRFGFSAKMTLQIAQALYERHKVLTYPRTDSRALPEDYQDTVKQTIGELGHTQYRSFAEEIISNQWVQPNKRIFNNAKISDHFAIVPTSLIPKKLNETEEKIYDMVTRRFLAIFYPAAEYKVTTRITRVEGEPFKTDGKILTKPGWLKVYGKNSPTGNDGELIPIEPGETVHTSEIELKSEQTRPPARFTEATLLSAMEGAGKMIEDEELRSAMMEKGLGTPATRASIIEGLISEKYIVRENRELRPTPKAISLIVLLRGLGIPELCSPELTGGWEAKLKQIEHRGLKREDFMKEIQEMTRNIISKTKQYEHDSIPGIFGILKTSCPNCKGELQETYRKFQCKSCDFAIWKSIGGRLFDIKEADELISKRTIGPLDGFRSKMGRPFSAIIKLNTENKTEFDFGQSDSGTGANGDQDIDFSDKTPLGKCPACGEKIYEHGMSYLCEKSVGKEKKCKFRSGKIILQRTIQTEEMKKLLETGRTDLLHRFISKKGRPFSAYLVSGKDGKVGFEFENRKSKTTKKKTAKDSKTKSS